MPPPAPIAAVLFDLDGTLVDSAPRIAAALNHALAVCALPSLDPAFVTGLIGGGPATLVERALRRLDADPRNADRLLARYRESYLALEAPCWALYPGVAATLDALAGMHIRRGVVTNTLPAFAEAILDRCGVAARIQALVSGDGALPLKPQPHALLRACALLGVAPASALVVGDSATDVSAARAAGMRVACMSYGYSHGASVRELGCDAVLDDIAGLPAWIEETNAAAGGARSTDRPRGSNP